MSIVNIVCWHDRLNMLKEVKKPSHAIFVKNSDNQYLL